MKIWVQQAQEGGETDHKNSLRSPLISRDPRDNPNSLILFQAQGFQPAHQAPVVSPLLFCVFYLEPLLYGFCCELKGGGSLIRAGKTTHTPYPAGLRDVGGRGLPVCLAGPDQTENSAGGEFCWWSVFSSTLKTLILILSIP